MNAGIFLSGAILLTSLIFGLMLIREFHSVSQKREALLGKFNTDVGSTKRPLPVLLIVYSVTTIVWTAVIILVLLQLL